MKPGLGPRTVRGEWLATGGAQEHSPEAGRRCRPFSAHKRSRDLGEARRTVGIRRREMPRLGFSDLSAGSTLSLHSALSDGQSPPNGVLCGDTARSIPVRSAVAATRLPALVPRLPAGTVCPETPDCSCPAECGYARRPRDRAALRVTRFAR
jgi:hypothetical protein